MKSVVEFYYQKFGEEPKESFSLLEMLKFTEEYFREVVSITLSAAVANEFGVEEANMFSKSRLQDYVGARQMYALLLAEQYKVKPPRIADHIGLDRCTILHSIGKMKDLIETEPKLKVIHQRLTMQINGNRVYVPDQLIAMQ